MFLVIGTPDCKFCIDAKNVLNSNSLEYIYYDLSLKYGESWRDIFTYFKACPSVPNNRQPRGIPIIFRFTGIVPQTETPVFELPTDPLEWSADWEYIGGIFDLEDYLDTVLDGIDDNY